MIVNINVDSTPLSAFGIKEAIFFYFLHQQTDGIIILQTQSSWNILTKEAAIVGL